jgi:hypothetical protein
VQSQIIAYLLDMSGIISGKVQLDLHWVSLNEVVSGAIDAIRPSAQTKGQRLRITLDGKLGLTRELDSRTLVGRLIEERWLRCNIAIRLTLCDARTLHNAPHTALSTERLHACTVAYGEADQSEKAMCLRSASGGPGGPDPVHPQLNRRGGRGFHG